MLGGGSGKEGSGKEGSGATSRRKMQKRRGVKSTKERRGWSGNAKEARMF